MFLQIRLSAEALLTVGALLYILSALREARFLGAKMFFENLVNRIKFEIKIISHFSTFPLSLPHRAPLHHVSCFYFLAF
jgi:hypothetical protein